MKKSFLPAILLCVFALCGAARAQTMPEPYQEKLLNGLKVLVWNDPKADNVTLKLRIHAGSAFDPKDKMGVMALLSDTMFPDPQTFSYFTDDLEGKLEVTSNYDYIQVTATGKADAFLSILDTVRVALVNTPITQENFVKVRDARLATFRELTATPDAIADRAAAKRLLGDFPYARPSEGTPESLAKIDRFDLVTAKEKFLDADNATLAITGRVEPRYAVRAAKQSLGNWLKSDNIVPATFTQPNPPDPRIMIVDTPGAADAEVRFMWRGLASNDKDLWPLIIWTTAFEQRLRSELPAECRSTTRINNQPHVLPGIFSIEGSYPVDKVGQCVNAVKGMIANLETEKVKPEDFTKAQNGIVAQLSSAQERLDYIADTWLNLDTFKHERAIQKTNTPKTVTLADGERAAARVLGKGPYATVILGDAAKIKSQFDAGTLFGLTPEQEVQVKKEITDAVSAWNESLVKRDIDSFMKSYGKTLEIYYRDNNKDQDAVRADMLKAFERWSTMASELSKVVVKPDSENLAYVVLDKRWDYRNKEQIAVGYAQQELKIVKNGGVWQIASEKDLHIYFMDTKKIAPPAKPQ